MRSTATFLTLVIVLVGRWSTEAAAQERIYKWFGDKSLQEFGSGLSADGDVTGDGIVDFIVGAPIDSSNLGMLRAFSGNDGSVVWTLSGNPGEHLGTALTGLGDVDLDGIADFIATSVNPPFANPQGWGVTLYSGATQAPIYTVLGSVNEALGAHIVSMGDVEGDGISDCAASSFGGTDVQVISGSSGSFIHTLLPPSDAGIFGFAIASGGDVDGDGVQDLVMGDPYAIPGGTQKGETWVYSGAGGTLLYKLIGPMKRSYFGQSVAIIHDVDQDGFADVLVGSPREVGSGGGDAGGHARVYSGVSGALLLIAKLPGPQLSSMLFGNSVADAGDLNLDGIGDFFVQQQVGGELYDFNSNYSVVHAVSGRDGGDLYHYFDAESPMGGFGNDIALTADLDHDGRPEAAITSPYEDDGSGLYAGAVSIWRTDDLYVNAVPRLIPSIGGPVSITVGQGVAGAPFALFLVDVNGIPATLLASVGLLDGTGRFVVSGQAPSGLSGSRFGFKAFALDANLKVIDSGVETLYFQ
jgi:FG-GAP repeat protein